MPTGLTIRRRRPVDPLVALTQPLIIRSRPLRTAQACLPGGLIVPAHRFLWYYEARTPGGELAATIHLEEGVVMSGCDGLWRVTQRDGVYTLTSPAGIGSAPAASYFVGNAGLFQPVRRLTLGDERVGGFEVGGNGWRGGWLTSADSENRVLKMSGEGDPPSVYHIAPVTGAPDVPVSAALLLSYVLIEREVRTGCWIPRPQSAAAA